MGNKTITPEVNTENNYNEYTEAMSLLTEKGLTLSEKMKVRNSFINWAHSFNPNVEKSKEFYKSKLIPNYCFSNESEAEFITALKLFSPETDNEKLIKVFAVAINLLGKESEWKF